MAVYAWTTTTSLNLHTIIIDLYNILHKCAKLVFFIYCTNLDGVSSKIAKLQETIKSLEEKVQTSEAVCIYNSCK